MSGSFLTQAATIFNATSAERFGFTKLKWGRRTNGLAMTAALSTSQLGGTEWTRAMSDILNSYVSELDEAKIDSAAKKICEWIGYSWEGVGERDISDRFPDWAVNGVGSRGMQGGKPALRRIARAVILAYLEAVAPTHVLVPREPTEKMKGLGGSIIFAGDHDLDDFGCEAAADVYRTMLDAALQPKPDGGE